MATQGDGPKRRVNPKYLAVIAIVLFGSAALAGFYSFGMQPSGTTVGSSSSNSSSTTACTAAAPEVDQRLAYTTFGAITEYTLPANRTPSGVAVAPDGSAWFGEWGLPGVAHLFPNGTITEYKWPYPDPASISNCQMATQIWGVALWNGSVWGSDFLYSRLVGVNPSTGQAQKIDLANGTTPYTLAVSPNNYLWFTESKLGAAIGRVSPTNGTVDYYNLPTAKYWESVYVLFKSDSTAGYVLALDGADPDALCADRPRPRGGGPLGHRALGLGDGLPELHDKPLDDLPHFHGALHPLGPDLLRWVERDGGMVQRALRQPDGSDLRQLDTAD